MENGTAITNNLNVDKVDQRFETPRKVSWIEQGHMWKKDRPTSHKTPQVAPIIPREVQNGEAQRRTNSL
jgi:hypothetical protein